MTDNRGFDMILAVVNSGDSEIVMQAAKDAGASGGTVVSAKGNNSSSFNKELIMILTTAAKREAILEAICAKADLNTDGRGIAFSVPVDDVVGIVSV